MSSQGVTRRRRRSLPVTADDERPERIVHVYPGAAVQPITTRRSLLKKRPENLDEVCDALYQISADLDYLVQSVPACSCTMTADIKLIFNDILRELYKVDHSKVVVGSNKRRKAFTIASIISVGLILLKLFAPGLLLLIGL